MVTQVQISYSTVGAPSVVVKYTKIRKKQAKKTKQKKNKFQPSNKNWVTAARHAEV